MKSKRELSCEQRIDSKLRYELENLREIWNNYCNNDLPEEEREEAMERLNNHGLSFDYVVPGTFKDQEEGYFQYLISWGGPSDMFRFYVNPDFSCYKVVYCFQDWFDGAERTLYNDDKELLLEIYNDFKGCGTCEYIFNKAMEDF